MDPFSASSTLAQATEPASRSADRSLAARLVVESARVGESSPDESVAHAARGVGLLESAMRVHVALLDSGAVRDANRGSDQPVRDGLAGAWLIGRASEAIAECGDDATALWAETARSLVRAEIMEFEDLYDAGRSPARCLTVAEMRTGSLFALAARLGGLLGKTEPATVDALDEYGRQLGIATEIRADVAALNGANGRVSRPPGPGSGRYGLPVLYALEADSELVRSLGRPLDDAKVVTLIERIRSANGFERAERESATRMRAALAALSGVRAEGLLELAKEVT